MLFIRITTVFIIKIAAQDIPTMNSNSCKKLSEDYEGPFKPAKVMKEGNILDAQKFSGKITSALEYSYIIIMNLF